VRPQNAKNWPGRHRRVHSGRSHPMEKETTRPRGRPPKLGKRIPLLVRLPEDVYQALRRAKEEVAKREPDASMAKLVGTAVEEWLARRRSR
jgi:hypothetical protein